MPPGACWSWRPLSSPSHSHSPGRLSWSDETFIESDPAEAALCADRAVFVRRNDIITLTPKHIEKRMIHCDANAGAVPVS